MLITEQLAQIFIEAVGCTIIYFGATYPPDKVTCSNMAIDVIVNKLAHGEYLNVIISGEVDYKEKETGDEITITSIKLPC